MTDRKKPGAAFWATVLLVVPMLYVLSFGPACWITSRTEIGAGILPTLYRPMIWAWDSYPQSLHHQLLWYSRVGAKDWWWCGEGESSEWVPSN
jgi:hypothetical protein